MRTIRNLRAENKVKSNRRIAATLVGGDKTNLLEHQVSIIAALAGLDASKLEIHQMLKEKLVDSAVAVTSGVEVYLPLAGMVDLDEERARLEKELEQTLSHVKRLEALLKSDFADKAPEAVVAKEREKLAAFQKTAEKIKTQLG